MTELHFEKWQATGNDFILMDMRDHHGGFPDSAHIAAWCDRRFGIGADGLMFLARHPSLAFKMQYFNADGREAAMCGNGARSMLGFAHRLGMAGSTVRFQAADGEHSGYVLGQDQYRIDLIDVDRADAVDLPEIIQWVPQYTGTAFFLNTGVPHLVIGVNHIADLQVREAGRLLRNHHRFLPHGTNVNFVEQTGESLRIRTYERGVEDETLSCGTGATAAAIVMGVKRHLSAPIQVQVEGGELIIRFVADESGGVRQVSLEGEAKAVFSGSIRIKE